MSSTDAPKTGPIVLDVDALQALRDGGFTLIKSHGDPTSGAACAADLIAWKTTGDLTDMPPCVHNVFARLIQRINDDKATSTDDMWRLVFEVGPLVVGSADWPVMDVLRVYARCGLTVDGFVAALAQRANLSGANLSGADLSSADLSRADLSSADLSRADLRRADLSSANLSRADLSSANLSRADLRRADLSSADLRRADLSSANLYGADLRRADLSRADLYGANLSSADLSGANGNQYTALPAGWKVTDSGLIVKDPS